jgi:chromosome segregation ATPase
MLQDRLTVLEVQNDYNEKRAIDFETKYKTLSELYDSSKLEYEQACSRIKDVNNTKSNFEMLSEHRLIKIKDLEREIYLKEDKILEFRSRFESLTQKLIDKDETLRKLQIERDKVESQFQKFKKSMIEDGVKSPEESPDASKSKLKAKKDKWIKSREREEKSFIDANDYILVCKRLKEVQTESQYIREELDNHREHSFELNRKYNEIFVENENLERKAKTSAKMIEELNSQKIEIQYKADQVLNDQLEKFKIESFKYEMRIEEFSTKMFNLWSDYNRLKEVS